MLETLVFWTQQHNNSLTSNVLYYKMDILQWSFQITKFFWLWCRFFKILVHVSECRKWEKRNFSGLDNTKIYWSPLLFKIHDSFLTLNIPCRNSFSLTFSVSVLPCQVSYYQKVQKYNFSWFFQFLGNYDVVEVVVFLGHRTFHQR